MDRLESMSVVVAVAEAGSLSAASRKLGIPVATASRNLSELETRLNTQLFQRSSRQMRLTDAGRSYIEACKRIIEQVEDAEREVSGEYRVPSGDLTVTSPWGLGHMHLVPIACEFLEAYPDIALRLLLTDRVLRPLEDHIDVSIRIGPLADSSMIATRIGSVRLVVCASPAYLVARGRPERLDDLASHNCITIDDFGAPRTWKFVDGNREIAVPIRSRLTVSTSEAAVEAAIAGAGIAKVMSYKMEAARRAGALVIMLEPFEQEPLPVHIVYPERKPMPLKLRAFLNWITPRLKARLAGPAD
ncbi:LysR family transcriptional regulator [Mesorhizobium sp. ASY16-5R]|uniref:LysR family transcriptional regulator n=1 Tax=Mesorhizobium sp. ASY16-5R TaxID=3445772 RepID=UPI003F9F1F47